MGVMRHLADFLLMLSVPCRVSYLPLLHEIIHSTNPFNWRLRQCLAVQVPDLLLLPPPELVFNTLYLLIITLLQDPVASVRRDSFTGVAKMMMVLSDHGDSLSTFACIASMNLNTRTSVAISNGHGNTAALNAEQSNRWTAQHLASTAAHHVDTVARAINSLIQSKTYQLRQLWVELCHALLLELPQSLFEKYFLDGLLYLTSDPVSNVRVAVGLVLAGWGPDQQPTLSEINSYNPDNEFSDVSGKVVSPWVWLLRRPDVKECAQRLSCDDNDVYSSIIKLQSIFPDITVRAISCRGLRVAPGGTIPVPNVITGAFTAEIFRTFSGDDKYSDNDPINSSTEDSEDSIRRVTSKGVDGHQYIAENTIMDLTPERGRNISVGSPQGDKERGGSFGVKSPGRGAGVLATAIAGLMQQQEEEIEQERLMHLKKSCIPSEVGEADQGQGLDHSHGCLDALMREEGDRASQGIRPRGMSMPGEIIYDEDEEEELHEDSSCCLPISPTASGGDTTTKYAEQDDYEVPILCLSPSSSLAIPTSLNSSFNNVVATIAPEVYRTDADKMMKSTDIHLRTNTISNASSGGTNTLYLNST